MSCVGLFIEKGGVTLDIPLCNSSTILMTLHLLFDCYIQPLTLDIHLTWLNITMHMYSCETTWLEKALQDITNTQSTVVGPNLWYACDGEASELMPILVIREGMHAPHGDILVKRTLASLATSALVQRLHPTHLLTCTWSSWVQLNRKHTDASMLIFKCVLVVMRINLPKCMFSPSLTLLLIFTLVSVFNGLDCMQSLNDMHAAGSFACDQQHCSPCLLCVTY